MVMFFIKLEILLSILFLSLTNAFEVLNTTCKNALPAFINVHTFGDSHSRWHPSILQEVRTKCILQDHSMPRKTMHGAIKLGHDVINFHKYKVQKNSIVMFNFGEIDSSNHLHKFKDSGLYKEIVRLVTEYEELILVNAKLVPSANIWIGGLVPTKFSTHLAHLGSNHERLLYNRLLNDEIMRMARRNNFFYLDNYGDYADEGGFLSYPLSDSYNHIGPEKFTLKTKQAIANEIDRIFGVCEKSA